MGCSYDMLGAIIHRKEDIKTFVEIYNRELEDSLYYGADGFISEHDFKEVLNSFCMSYNQEPLFKYMNQGEPYERMILIYLKAVPDAPFSAWYRCTYDNCGATDTKDYTYSDGVLKIQSSYSEDDEITIFNETLKLVDGNWVKEDDK